MVYLLSGIIAAIFMIPMAFVIGIEHYQFKRNKALQKMSKERANTSTLVVYFSRSGNTALMATEIARLKNANLLTINANRYQIGIKGWFHAMQDARDTIAEIYPEEIDLTRYDTIYMGSPIWLYSPAPPIWEFARQNNFKDKAVILFNSLNSKFEQHYIDNFAQLIEKKGGSFVKHIFVIRGRMTRQMEVDEFLEAVRSEMEA